MKKFSLAAVCLVLLLAGADRPYVDAQVTYARGQDVSPTFDGWQQNPDGTYTLHFGYFNRNSDEEIDVPIGPENNVDPGGDRGQPTHFYATRRWWVFKVVVPADWPKDRRAVWTLTTHGKTNQAKGWLQPEWEVDNDLIFKNAGRDPSLMTAGINQVDMDHENLPPVITGKTPLTGKVSEPLMVTATATDDGRPKPVSDPQKRLQQGVRMRWSLYRGPASVRFEPEIMPGRVYGKSATLETKVTFSAPGVYRLRAVASDGQAFSSYDVDVDVK